MFEPRIVSLSNACALHPHFLLEDNDHIVCNTGNLSTRTKA